jgi:hypothetical protein
MRYDLANTVDFNRFETRVLSLKLNKKRVELKEVKEPRSIKQNSYLHVVLSLYGISFGYTLEESKTDLKRWYGLIYEKNGKKYLKSSRDLDTKELTDFIEFIREKAAINGFYIPTSDEYLLNKYNIDNEIETNKKFL